MAEQTTHIELADRRHKWLALFLGIVMALTVLIALGFEHIGGMMPCKLCLEERIPYYIGAPLMILTAFLAALYVPSWLVRLLFFVAALFMFYNLTLSIYHAGAEYKFWPGPADCSAATTAITTDAGNLLANLNKVRPPSCDKAVGYFLGLSFAGWNAVASLGLGIIALIGALIRPR